MVLAASPMPRDLASAGIARVAVSLLAKVTSAVSVCVDRNLVLAGPLGNFLISMMVKLWRVTQFPLTARVSRVARCRSTAVCRSWLAALWVQAT
jgi:hypothetical protein